jgi:hypothetical protein
MLYNVTPSEETITGRRVAAIQLLMTEQIRLEKIIKETGSEFSTAIREATEDYREEAISPVPSGAKDVKARLVTVRDGILSVQSLASKKKEAIDKLKAKLVTVRDALQEVVFAAPDMQQDLFGRAAEGVGFTMAAGTYKVISGILGRLKTDGEDITDDQAELDGVLSTIGVQGLRLVDSDENAPEVTPDEVEPEAEDPEPEAAEDVPF